MSLFKLGKVHVPHRKNTAEAIPVRMPAPAQVSISMLHHIGAPATPVVKPGDKVYVGTLVGEAAGYVSSPVHSSVSGTVKKIEKTLVSAGKEIDSVVIESDGEMTPDPDLRVPEITDFASFSAAVRASGLVGLGGAGFPTSVKLDAIGKGIIKRLVLNGAECEPYITSDTRTMVEKSDLLREGVELLCRFCDFEEVVFGIEKNKPEAIAKLKDVFADMPKVRICPMPSTYPQGGEKILIYNTTGLVVPEGKLPADVGVIVMNVTSLAFLASYVKTGMPLVEKVITVDGSAIASPANVIAPIGTSLGEVIEFVGGTSCEIGKILLGGPMMGVAVWTDAHPVLKTTNAITVLSERDAAPPKSTACIHCGRCVSACPMGLQPTYFARALNISDKREMCERLEDEKIGLCIECGCCSFVCPAKRPLVENNRLAKAAVREYKTSTAAAGKKGGDK
ncbi:MAG: electron transport complex subunit RsxC [Clostridia bacterium]|nr:electron transport complex subunit RsxC [Clostridia bacterium]